MTNTVVCKGIIECKPALRVKSTRRRLGGLPSLGFIQTLVLVDFRATLAAHSLLVFSLFWLADQRSSLRTNMTCNNARTVSCGHSLHLQMIFMYLVSCIKYQVVRYFAREDMGTIGRVHSYR